MTHPRPATDADHGTVTLHDLAFVDDGEQVIIGLPGTDSFAVFPADAAEVVRRLSTGEPVDSVAGWYEEAYGQPADLGDFVATLHDLGFVRQDGEARERPAAPARIRWRRLGAAAFSVPALALYAAGAAGALYLMVSDPALRPTPSKAFFTTSLLIVIGTDTAAQFAGIAVHEWFHVLAGRRIGLASRLTIGRRLFYVVFQTTLVGIMGVPSRKRILPFLAGLIADAVLISILTGLAAAAHVLGWPAVVARVCVAVAYTTLVRMLWQAQIFLETDLNHLLASALRCPDLHSMTRTYLREQAGRLRGRPVTDGTELGWSGRDLRTVRWFAPFAVAGSATMIGLVGAGVIPFLAGLVLRMYHAVTANGLTSPLFWDSLLTGTAVIAPFATAAALAFRDRRRRLAEVSSGSRHL